jgi:O-antigen/teichoic acid export membrane protein
VSRRRIFGNATIYLGTTVLNAAIPFLLLPVLTRVLTPADYGVVAMFSVMLSVFGAFAGLSVHGAVSIRFFQLPKEELAEYVATCLGILVCSTALLALVVALAGEQLARLTGIPVDWLLFGVVLSGLQFVVNIRLALWQAMAQAGRYGAFMVTQGLTNALVSLGLILGFGLAWQGRLWGQATAIGVFAGVALWQLAAGSFLRRPAQWKRHAGNALHFGIPVIPHIIGGLLIVSADRLVIVNQLGVTDAGIYMVALQVGQAIGLLTDSFNKAYAPWLMKRLSEAEAPPRVRIVRGTYLYFAVILALAWLYGLLAPPLLQLIVGRSFHAAGPLVPYLALGYAFGGCYYMVTNYIFFESRTAILAGVTLCAGIANVILTVALVGRYGLEGAGLAFVLSNALMFLGTWWLAQRVHPMPWLNALRPTAT